jgi:hypothetical protein
MAVLKVVFLWDEVREEREIAMPSSTLVLLLEDGIKNRLEVEYQGIVEVVSINSIPFVVGKKKKAA